MKYIFAALFFTFFSLTASAALPAITGSMSVCEGSTTTLSDATAGGTWSSGNPAVATIGASSGVVAGIAAGTADITYTDGTDFAYAVVTVAITPAPISGILAICDGNTTTLVTTTTGGTWISSNVSVAPIGAATGIVTGVSAGTSTIAYVLTGGCATYAVVTVSPIPSAIAGSGVVCVGTTTMLSNTIPGGGWSSASPAVAAVSSSGTVTGLSTGTATISYTLTSGCGTSRILTVSPAIGSITGSLSVCLPLTSTLSHPVSGGSWSSANIFVAVVGSSSGVVSGVSVGTASITYLTPSGCFTTAVVTVNTSGTVSGTASICAGASTAFTSTAGPGGSWSSVTATVATVGTSGIVYGTGVGTSVIVYTTPTCGSASRTVTVTSSCSGTPVTGAITASSSLVCSGTPLVLNLPTYTPVCGHLIQWQYSADGMSWSNLPGANTVPYTYYPTAAYFYRCGITCATGGASAFSGPIHVTVDFTLGTHTVLNPPATTCGATHFYIAACGVSSTFSVAAFYGDGTTDTVALSSATLSDAHLYHTYTSPGTYTVKYILFNGILPVDTVLMSYEYNYCRTLPIKFYKDNNANCLFDAGDNDNLVAVTCRIDSNGVPVDTITATSGFYYEAHGGPGTVYAFRPISVAGGLVNACPSSGVIYDTITTYTNTYVAKYFGLVCGTATVYDLRVEASTLSNSNRQRITILVSNTYCTSVSPVVTLNMSPKYGYYPTLYPCTATYPAPTTASGTTMTWNLGPVAPSSTATITVYLARPASLGAPLAMGDTLSETISVSPISGDVNLANNVLVKHDTVVASYDPNDIAVSPGGYVLPCAQLTYTVRFENTGSDTAHNVYVLDTLAPGLDPASLMVDEASDPMTVSVISVGSMNIARFNFAHINLLDSAHHGQNDGMFIFKIKTRNPLPDGTVIDNRVGIYFDYSPVVMTNTVTNIIGVAPIVGPSDVCLGHPATMTNNTPGGTWASSTPLVATITGGGVVTGLISGTSLISYTVFNTCATRTAVHPITVSPVVIPDVTIAAGPALTVCAGTPVIYTASSVYGGTLPVYTWRVHGIAVGSGTTYMYTPAAGDTVIVTMASNQACAIPATVLDTAAMNVIAMATPVAAISVSPDDTSCAGSPVTFTATPSYGGPGPGYIWYVNGIASGTGPSHMYIPTTGDIVYCKMGSNFMCRLADTVTSSSIHMTVDPLYIPVISISASPGLAITAGESVTLTASVINAGPSPVYQWVLNGLIVAGETNNTYTSTAFADYDSVTCRVTGDGVCNITSFNSVYVTVWPVGVTPLSSGSDLHLFPNPNNGGFTVRGNMGTVSGQVISMDISNVLGQSVFRNAARTGMNGDLKETIQLPYDLANGMYILTLTGSNEKRMFRFVVER